MTFFGSDDLLEMKAILLCKVVAVGRFSNWSVLCRAAMNLPRAVTLGEKKAILTLDVIEDRKCMLGTSPEVLFPRLWMATFSTHPPCFGTMEIRLNR